MRCPTPEADISPQNHCCFGCALSSRNQILLLVAVAAGAIILHLCYIFQFELFRRGDNLWYIILSQALHFSGQPEALHLPGESTHLWWPPGFLLPLWLFFSIAGPQWVLGKLVFFMLLMGLALLLALTSRSHCFWDRLALLVLFFFNAAVHLTSSYLYSDSWYLLCLLSVASLHFSSGFSPQKTWLLLLSSVAVVYIAAIRLSGFTLIGAWMVTLLGIYATTGRGLKTLLLCLLLTGALIGLFWSSPWQVGSFRAFFVSAQDPAQVALASLEQKPLLQHFGNQFLAIFGSLIPQTLMRGSYSLWPMNSIKMVLGLGVSAVVLWGWVICRKRNVLLSWYFLFYLAHIMIYGALYLRLMIGVAPVVVYYFYFGLKHIVQLFFRQKKHAAIVFFTLILLVSADAIIWATTSMHRYMQPEVGGQALERAEHLLDAHASDSAIVASHFGSYLYVMRFARTYSSSGRAVAFARHNGKYPSLFEAASTDQALFYLQKNNVEFLVLVSGQDQRSQEICALYRKTILQFPDCFRQVTTPAYFAQTVVYQLQQRCAQ